jgi:hypothetical protein
MATETISLSQPFGNRSAVLCTLARQKAVKAIKRQLQARGIRLNDVTARDIHIWADAYLEVHRQELIEQAMEMVSSSRELRKLYEREQRQRAKLNNSAQMRQPFKSTTSAVQNSCSKVGAQQ